MSSASESPHRRGITCPLPLGSTKLFVRLRELCTHKAAWLRRRQAYDLYGEHMELVSDPFLEGDCVAVHVISRSNPIVRTIDLPVSILAGSDDMFPRPANPDVSE
jgi:hypothetical protein